MTDLAGVSIVAILNNLFDTLCRSAVNREWRDLAFIFGVGCSESRSFHLRHPPNSATGEVIATCPSGHGVLRPPFRERLIGQPSARRTAD